MSSESKGDDKKYIDYTKIFKNTYERNLNNILTTFQDVDGSLDRGKMNTWIEKQNTEEKKEACRVLSEKTQYFSFDETLTLLENATTKLLDALDNPVEQKLAIFLSKSDGKKAGGSLRMFAILGYYMLLKKGVPDDNIVIVDTFYPGLFEEYVHIYFDDFSYSGSQLKQILEKIRCGKSGAHPGCVKHKTKRVRSEQKHVVEERYRAENLNLHVVLSGLSTNAQDNINQLNDKRKSAISDIPIH